MRQLAALLFGTSLLATASAACEAPICVVDADTLFLARTITFDDQPSSFGVGRQVEDVLIQPGVSFGERFAGQSLTREGNYDRVGGTALAPLTVIPGAPGQTLGILRLMATSVLHGHGPEGFPKREATGEGAIAALFENDQSAIAFDIRGGEQGEATVTFLRRDGHPIHSLRLGPLAEATYGFKRRDDISDIAGLVIENADPEGIALDNLRFDRNAVLSLLLTD
ncbi:hypothetical protein [Shimia aestuarii]|uniref:Uncharacterized protein n=1 Tax=Shimia aestuarii TaxID=254406 RepID=A0A1I4QJD9_9RHOB|nr:hypothetical protein [Shimia aestuarii]SFM40179.1 hypothetical protein SAMN04488042_10714 [Shimia aestuarii]